MENQNILTIKFNTLDDLAVQIADWNERLNRQCDCERGHAEPEKSVNYDRPEYEAEPETKAPTEPADQPEPQEVPVQPLDAEPIKTAEPVPEEALDVSERPVDKKEFYKEFKSWMGADKTKAEKALAVFKKHGVASKITSDVLTDDIVTDLKTVMAE